MTTRFTDLTEIAAVDVDDADVLALSDVSASASRKVTVSSLRTTVGAPLQLQATWNTGTDTTESTISPAKLDDKIANSRQQGGTIVATTSGTAFDFTGIPAEVQEVEVLLDGVSLSGADNLLVQIGTSGGIVTTGYTSESGGMFATSGSAVVSSTSGFVVRAEATKTHYVGMRLRRLAAGSNVWVSAHSGAGVTDVALSGGGSITLGAELDRVRITRTGTNTFDAGQLNVRWK